jgi:hypothetical protein
MPVKKQETIDGNIANVEFVYNEKTIRCEGTWICLTDLWNAIGKPKGKHDPRRWKGFSGQEFIDSVAKKLNVLPEDIYKTTRGRGGASWAHWQIGLAYAKYLSPELHMHVNEVYMRYRLGDISLAEEVVARTTPEQQELHLARMQGIVTRNFLTRSLQEHGVRGYGFARCTNNTYKGLFDKNAKQLREQKGLPVKTNVREHMNIEELVSVSFAEILAKNDISVNEFQGNQECANSCYQNGTEVKKLLQKQHRPVSK